MNFFSFSQYAHLMRRSKSQVKRNERRVFVELLADADDDYHKFSLLFCVYIQSRLLLLLLLKPSGCESYCIVEKGFLCAEYEEEEEIVCNFD